MRRRATLAGVVLLPAFVCGIAAFARAASFDFVYDDHWTVEGARIPFGRLVRWLATGTAHAHGVADATRPVMALSVWIDRALFGASPVGYHAHSLVLYGMASTLAAWVSLELTGRHRVAIVSGLVFALAPVHAEVACAINYREDALMAIGVLVALGCLVRARPSSPRADAIGAAGFAMALFSKESAVVLVPIAGAAMLLVPRVRARILAKRRLLVALAVAFVVWALWRFAIAVDDVPRANTALGARLLGTARYCVRTGVAALIPFRACPDYARLPAASALWFAPLAAWGMLIVFLGRRTRTRIVALGLAVLLLAPIATSPLALPVNEIADRYAFVAVLGTGLIVGWIAARIRTRTLAIVLCPIALALGWACDIAGAPWKTDRTLWTEATKQSPASPRAWLGLSKAMRVAGDLDEADRAIDRALALDPNFIGAHVTRTYNLLARGNVEGARSELAIIHGLRGDDHAGVALATRCAALEREAAVECIR